MEDIEGDSRSLVVSEQVKTNAKSDRQSSKKKTKMQTS